MISAVPLQTLDTFNGFPFAGTILPSERLPGIFAFEIGPLLGNVPGPAGAEQAVSVDLVPPFAGLPLVQKIIPVSGPGVFSYLAPSVTAVPEPGASSLVMLTAALLLGARALCRRAL